MTFNSLVGQSELCHLEGHTLRERLYSTRARLVMLQRSESIESLISRMRSSGGNVDIGMARSILERKDEALPYLIEIVRNESYWKSNEVDGWAPLNAAHLLSVIGGREALDALMYATYNFTEEMDDWLTEDLPSVLAYFGPSAVDTLASALSDSKLEPFARNTVGRALRSIARKHENLRERTIGYFVNAISNEKDMLARTLMVDVLIEFKERDTLPLVRGLFSRNLLDRSTLQPQEVEDVYAGKYDHILHSDDADPMDLFRKDKPKWYSTSQGNAAMSEMKADAHLDEELGENVRGRKIGRNESCPCGSGKKYKKCCLIKERIRC